MTLTDALGGMAQIAQWFLWRLEWSASEGKYLKTPCYPHGGVERMDASLPSNWMSYDDAQIELALLPKTPELQYTLGFWLTDSCGYWFLDLDKAAVDGELLPFAQTVLSWFPGAMVEWSSSGKGVHVFGRTAVNVPDHRSKPPKERKAEIAPVELEFYTNGRGVAFGLSGLASGSADTLHDANVAALVAYYFPPRAEGDGPRGEWRGPADDDELIRRALNARASAEVLFGNKAGFPQLWRGEVEHNSEHDMALASHLAFWTGCDEERMKRLMLKSGMIRDKWRDHRTYLDITIRNACAGCSAVYQEPVRNADMYASKVSVSPGAGGDMVPADITAKIDNLMALISGCGTDVEMHNTVVPAIQAVGVPEVFVDKLANAMKHKLTLLGSPLPLPKCRQLVSPPAVKGALLKEAPLWAAMHCFVLDGDYFYCTDNGSKLTMTGFQAKYTRMMPTRENGQYENPADWALNRWNIPTVQYAGYRPDQGTYFTWQGYEYVNTYNPNSVPVAATSYSEAGIEAIREFQQHLFDMCGRRIEVFNQLLWWLAHNVQRPGVKVRWSPLIKGAPGDGKSLLAAVMRAAMGGRNVGVTDTSVLMNSGGFTDWACGYALNFIEEIWITGKERYRLYNATKTFITNDIININAKGRPSFQTFNTTNHMAFSNHNDAIPLEQEDRRWFIVFTPWASLADMIRYCGLDPEGWSRRTGAVDYAIKNLPHELRAWLLSVPIGAEFDKDGSAPITSERGRMLGSTTDDIESIAQSVILEGAHGITHDVISSSCLTNLLRVKAIAENLDVPKGMALNHMMGRLGYAKVGKQIKWRNATHTIWLKNGVELDNDTIRQRLEASAA